MDREKKITSFRDLEVYSNSYNASVQIVRDFLPKLPAKEKYDLADQILRACKAVPRLIAEGYAKRHQKAGFQKYLDDAMAECNELIVCFEHTKDIYNIDSEFCEGMIKLYDQTGRQLYRLASAWTNFKNRRPTT